MKLSTFKKEKWGDRADGRWIKGTGMQTIMANVLPNRTDCEVCCQEKIDATELLKFLEKRNAERPEYKTTVFHCALLVIARIIKERPYLNRFIQGRRMYERHEISLSFVAKRRFADGAEEALLVVVPKDDTTIDSLSRYIVGDVKETRKSEHSTGGVDKIMDDLAKLPRPILYAAGEETAPPAPDEWRPAPDGTLRRLEGGVELVAVPRERARVPGVPRQLLREIDGREYLVFPL